MPLWRYWPNRQIGQLCETQFVQHTVYEASAALIQSYARHFIQHGVYTPPDTRSAYTLSLQFPADSLQLPVDACSSLQLSMPADGARRTALCTPPWTCCCTRRRTCRTSYLSDLRRLSNLRKLPDSRVTPVGVTTDRLPEWSPSPRGTTSQRARPAAPCCLRHTALS